MSWASTECPIPWLFVVLVDPEDSCLFDKEFKIAVLLFTKKVRQFPSVRWNMGNFDWRRFQMVGLQTNMMNIATPLIIKITASIVIQIEEDGPDKNWAPPF